MFHTAFAGLRNKECIAAFDPSCLPKSGKKTYGKDYFWSGKDQQTKAGLEIGCLAMIDVADATAYSLESVQTPAIRTNTLIEHYVSIIRKNAELVLSYTRFVAVDGYFMKKNFVDPVLDMRLQVITRMRPDANLLYIYSGPQKPGKGRKRSNGGKMDVNNIDKRRYEEDQAISYALIVKCVSLKRNVNWFIWSKRR